MPEPVDHPPPAQFDLSRGWARTLLAVVVVSFVLFRLPMMYRLPGTTDEDAFAVPGLTILKTGIPQLPYFPSRVPESVFYQADKVMYCMPPAYFYWQSLFYAALPDVYGTARLSSAAWGVGVLLLTSWLTTHWTGSRLAGVCASLLLAWNPVFFKFGTRARPDMMCACLGLLAIAAVLRWRERRTPFRLVQIGVVLGLCGLTHPLAIAFAILTGMWVLLESRRWQRILNPGLMAVTALLVFALWLPLILIDPDAFRLVMRNQYQFTSSTSLPVRLLNPLAAVTYHAGYLAPFLGTWKAKLVFWPLVGWSVSGLFVPRRGMREACLLCWSAFYLVATCAGTFHPTWGYFSLPLALASAAGGATLATVAAFLWRQRTWGRAGIACLGAGLGLLLLQGSEITVLADLIRHRNDVNYNAPRFAQQLLREIPEEARCTVDTEYVLDFYAAGRPVLCSHWMAFFFNAEAYPYDYYVSSRHSEYLSFDALMCGEVVGEFGSRETWYSCYAKISRPSPVPCEPVIYANPHFIETPLPKPYWQEQWGLQPTLAIPKPIEQH